MKPTIILAFLALSGCDDGGRGFTEQGLVNNWDYLCWEAGEIPKSNYCGGECLYNYADEEGRCWRVQSRHRPRGEGWGDSPIPFEEACPPEIQGTGGGYTCAYTEGYPY